jgi:alpha-L-fucosidase 2
LLQSHETNTVNGKEIPIIDLLPALPDVWDSGKISGLKACGNVEVEMDWENRMLTTATLLSKTDQTVNIRCKGEIILMNLKSDEKVTVLQNQF